MITIDGQDYELTPVYQDDSDNLQLREYSEGEKLQPVSYMLKPVPTVQPVESTYELSTQYYPITPDGPRTDINIEVLNMDQEPAERIRVAIRQTLRVILDEKDISYATEAIEAAVEAVQGGSNG